MGPDAIGARVVVRRRDVDGRVGDVLGVLERFDPKGLAVRRADGSRVDIAPRAVLAGRVVPPQRTTRRAIRELEEAAAAGWPGVEQHRLGAWLLRAGHGFTGRANSVLPLGDPDRPIDVAVADVVHWYAARGLVPRAQLPDRVGSALDATLGTLGWPAYNPTVVLTARLAGPTYAPAVPEIAPATIQPRPDDAWLAAYHYRGGDLPSAALEVLTAGPDDLAFGSVRAQGPRSRMLGIGRVAVTRAADGTVWAGLTAVEVAEDARRAGIGRHLVRGLLDWAADRGATAGYAQVTADNVTGRAFWDRLGFTEHHRYHYRRYPG